MTIIAKSLRELGLSGSPKKRKGGSPDTSARAPRKQTPKALLPENQVERVIVDFLRVNGWTVTRQQSALVRGAKSTFRVGTPGDPDWRAEKPIRPFEPATPMMSCFQFEVKAPGKKLAPHQQARIADLNARGFVAVVFDDFDKFREWYSETFEVRA